MENTARSLAERLNAHPQLRGRMESLLALVEGENEEVKQADEAERRVIETLRRLGNEVLRSWATQQEVVRSAAVSQQGAVRAGKKTLLVHDVRGNSRGRAPLLAGGPCGPAVVPLGRGPLSGVFPALRAADDGFGG